MTTAYGFPPSTWDPTTLPDNDTQFVDSKDIDAFAKALSAPEASQVVALNDWRPINQRVKRKGTKQRRKKPGPRSKDETREGFVYVLLKWPLFLVVIGWIVALGLGYLVTRLYIWTYERMVTWRGQRQKLRKSLRSKTNYDDWKEAAQDLDKHLGNEAWKEDDDYAYYDSSTARKVTAQLQAERERAENQRNSGTNNPVYALRSLVEACGTSLKDHRPHNGRRWSTLGTKSCVLTDRTLPTLHVRIYQRLTPTASLVKNNFMGVENPRLYSETYYGTKHLAQGFIDELERSLAYLLHSSQLSPSEKYSFAQHLNTNLGRTALCLSGGASFAWYHFGVVKALLDAKLLPDIVTGSMSLTSL